MDDQRKAQELLGQLGGKAIEAMTMWADANQRMLLELVEFSAATTKEGARLYSELLEGHAQAVARSAERLQTSAEQAGKNIQETCTAVATRMRDVYSQP